ncbi:hypothetical protein TNCV_1916641 [Trichonephila clavipes]|uniref:Uncharacterized protein n=1 Tax=Trichonephila clavipes TaxID=2585209 RepID=A0A8X6W0L6_TRICX|nr:hypothetical protein TNCV_1916641 [Trichonephila clavipes]
MVWHAVSYHGQFNLLRFEGKLNSNRYFHVVLQLEVVPFLHDIPGAMFPKGNARHHVAKAVRDLCSTQHMQRILWPAYSSDMSLLRTCAIWLVGISLVIRFPQL